MVSNSFTVSGFVGGLVLLVIGFSIWIHANTRHSTENAWNRRNTGSTPEWLNKLHDADDRLTGISIAIGLIGIALMALNVLLANIHLQ